MTRPSWKFAIDVAMALGVALGLAAHLSAVQAPASAVVVTNTNINWPAARQHAPAEAIAEVR